LGDQDTKDAFRAASEQVASAYENSRVGNKNMLIMGGLALGAMALAVFGSRSGK
jgi:hypothetical protein